MLFYKYTLEHHATTKIWWYTKKKHSKIVCWYLVIYFLCSFIITVNYISLTHIFFIRRFYFYSFFPFHTIQFCCIVMFLPIYAFRFTYICCFIQSAVQCSQMYSVIRNATNSVSFVLFYFVELFNGARVDSHQCIPFGTHAWATVFCVIFRWLPNNVISNFLPIP